MRAMGFGRGCRHLESGVAAKGAEQDARGFLDLGEFDRSLRMMGAGGLGDPVMPEFADEFFHDYIFPPASSSVFDKAEKPASLRLAASLLTQRRSWPFGLSRLVVAQAEIHWPHCVQVNIQRLTLRGLRRIGHTASQALPAGMAGKSPASCRAVRASVVLAAVPQPFMPLEQTLR